MPEHAGLHRTPFVSRPIFEDEGDTRLAAAHTDIDADQLAAVALRDRSRPAAGNVAGWCMPHNHALDTQQLQRARELLLPPGMAVQDELAIPQRAAARMEDAVGILRRMPRLLRGLIQSLDAQPGPLRSDARVAKHAVAGDGSDRQRANNPADGTVRRELSPECIATGCMVKFPVVESQF